MLGWQEIILVLAVLLLVFGPTELPKLARELGKAINEFNKASSGVMEAATSATAGSAPASPAPTQTSTSTTSAAIKPEDEKNKQLLDIAKKLGINAEGKSTDQLLSEIAAEIDNKNVEQK